MRALDLFSCIGCHALGLQRAGIKVAALCEIKAERRVELAKRFPEVPIYDDVRSCPSVEVEIVIGGPPCQATSVAAAVHGRRSGTSLWPTMLAIIRRDDMAAEWVVVEQPPGNKAWETQVAGDLCASGYSSARLEFAACDVGAPYLRRRVFILAGACVSRLALAWKSVPSAIERVKRAADARGDWDPHKLGSLPVDARSAGEGGKTRKERIEALGDSNPPHMAEVIGHAIMEAAA